MWLTYSLCSISGRARCPNIPLSLSHTHTQIQSLTTISKPNAAISTKFNPRSNNWAGRSDNIAAKNKNYVHIIVEVRRIPLMFVWFNVSETLNCDRCRSSFIPLTSCVSEWERQLKVHFWFLKQKLKKKNMAGYMLNSWHGLTFKKWRQCHKINVPKPFVDFKKMNHSIIHDICIPIWLIEPVCLRMYWAGKNK